MELLSILIILCSVLLILVVIIQNNKGGGLDSNIASQTQAFGAKKTTELVEKITWWLAGLLIVLSIASTKIISGSGDEELEDGETIENVDQNEADAEEGEVSDEE